MKEANQTPKAAKEFLDSPECKDDMSYEEFLEQIKTSKECYERSVFKILSDDFLDETPNSNVTVLGGLLIYN